MKKVYESPELEVVKFRLSSSVLTASEESSMNSQIVDFTEPGDIEDL